MPEFKLQEIILRPKIRPAPRILYNKNEYDPRVKVSDWQYKRNGYPKDHDPFNPCSEDYGHYFLSTYDRMGTCRDEWRTTAQDMNEQIFTKRGDVTVPKNTLLNYSTYKALNVDIEEDPYCPSNCADDYLTEMQDAYQTPYPMVLRPLKLPKIEFLQNRRLNFDNQDFSNSKFYDDGCLTTADKLGQLKGYRWISFDPLIGKYTNEITKEVIMQSYESC